MYRNRFPQLLQARLLVAIPAAHPKQHRATKKRPLPRWAGVVLIRLIFRQERFSLGSTTATAARGFATAAGFAATAGLAATAATMTVEQPAEAAQDAAAARTAARIAAALLTTTAGFTTAAGLSGATTARLSGAAGLFGTTAARFFRTAGLFAAAIVVLAEEVEQAAAMTATFRFATTRRLTTTLVTAEERRSAVGVRQGSAQDQRHNSKTKVHLTTPTNTVTGRGKHTWVHGAKQTRRRLLPHVASVKRRLRRRIVAFAWRTTLDSSSHAIVNPAWPA
jgi:hypothetical protein